jgi:hypothetical protein
MKHGLLISAMSFSAMSFVLVAGTGPSFAINPGPAVLGLGSGAMNEMAGQRLAQMQPGQGQQGGDQGQVTPGSNRSKRSAQAQPSGRQPGEKMSQQGDQTGAPGQPGGRKKAEGEKMGQQGEQSGMPGQPAGRKKAEGQPSGQQGEKMGTGTWPEGQKKATENEPSGQRKAGRAGEQSGSRMGAAGSKQPGAKGTESERGEAGIAAGGSTGAKGSASLTVQDRSKITTVIKEAKAQPVEKVNFAISVGTRVPHDVHLYTLPSEVVEIHPAWRHFEYILVRDDIIIINPSTFEIVAVLPLA